MTQPNATSKLRDNAIAIHRVMVRDSVVDPGTEATDKDLVIWEGSLSKIFQELQINPGYHTPLMRLLTQLDCVRQIQRGSRTLPSRYVLLRDAAGIPASEWPSFNSAKISSHERLTGKDSAAKLLEQRVEALEKRVGTLNLARALAELAQEIQEVKRLIHSEAKKG